MKILLNHLKEYIDIVHSPAQIAAMLTMAGLGVDAVQEFDGDTLFEISLTPNLGHCNSLLGVARELSAATNKPVHLPPLKLQENPSSPIQNGIKVDILNLQDCPRYGCRLIKNVTIAPSPQWLSRRLEAWGIRSINNVVDVTNYIMLALGHPLHAFDYNRLSTRQLIICNAQLGERFTTLDGKERELAPSDLLICDGPTPVALAGIMGGNNSEVSETTRNVLLEAACFSSTTIRKTSKRLGLMTDASKHFERGCDQHALKRVLDHAAALIQSLADGEVCQGISFSPSTPFPTKRQVTCRFSRINKILGTHLAISEVEEIFQRIDMPSKWDGQDTFTVEVPTYRNDVHTEIDLIEEVARIYGYDNINTPTSPLTISNLPHAPIFLLEREVRTRLLNEGLQEFLTCDLIGPTLLHITQEPEHPQRKQVHVLNPTSIEQSILRTTLLPGLLQVVKFNWDHHNHDVAGFEIGRIHFKEEENYREQSVASILLSGKSRPLHWDLKAHEFDFFDLKGIVENLLTELKIINVSLIPSNLSCLHPGRQVKIHAGSEDIGIMGEVHPAVLRRLDITQRILFAEINLHQLFQAKSTDLKMQPVPIYPGSERDWTITLNEETPINDLFSAIESTRSPLLENVSLLDIYRSDKLGKGLKNATFRFLYRDKNKTIEQEAVEKEHAHLIDHVLKSIKTHQTI